MPRMGAVHGISMSLLVAFVLAIVGGASPAGAGEGPLARYHGPATYYGQPAPLGTLVSVHQGNQVLASGSVFLVDGVASYDIAVTGDNPATPAKEGPGENETLAFRVNGVPADQVETFNDMEDRLLPLAVTRIAICLGAYEDVDRDLAHDPDEPWLAGVVINVLRFRTDLSYTTNGSDEPYCSLFVAEPKEVRAVDWPARYDPPSGQGQPSVRIDQVQGLFVVAFPFVAIGSAGATPAITNTPATPTPTAEAFPGPTGLTPLPTATPDGPVVPSDTPTPVTATAPPEPTQAPPPTPEAPGGDGVLLVNSAADPGIVGDDVLTLREALELATGELKPADLSAAEQGQLAGPTGPDVRDVIRFDPLLFPPTGDQIIYLRPPSAGGPGATRWVSAFTVCRPVFWGPPEPGLPPLSTGHDQIDATGAGVTLSGDLAGALVDGLVVTSDDNAVRGLTLTGFKAGVLLSGSARKNVVGGSEPGQGLTIGGSIAGIVLHGADVEGNQVLGNRLGLLADGSTPAGNATHGILVAGGAHDNLLGAPGAGNVVADSFGDGVAVVGGGTRRNRVQANRIGTNAGGDTAVPNGVGVGVGCGAAETLVGGPTPGEGNLISGNGAEGIWVLSPETRDTLVQGNRIGVAADGVSSLPNQGNGILIEGGARQSLVGGEVPGAGNVIARNLGAGVRVAGSGSIGNTVRRNRITANFGGGIVLDDGGNDRLPAPVLTLVEGDVAEGMAPPLSLVEVYSDPDDQGAWYEGSTQADETGWFRLRSGRVFRGPQVNALAVDDLGNSSPFGGLGELPTATATAATPPTGTPPAPAGGRYYLPIVQQGHVLFTSLALEPASTVLPMGGLVTLDLKVYGARDLFGMQLLLEFPADLLEVIDADPGTVGVQILPGDFPDPGRIFIVENRANNTTGIINYAFTLVEAPAADGDGVVARIRFRGRGPGRADITFREQMLSDENAVELAAQGLGATIQVLPPPSVTPAPSATASPRPSDTPRPSNTPVPSATPTRTAVPSPSHTPPPSASPAPTLTPTVTNTAEPSATSTDTAEPSATSTDTPLPTATSTGTAEPDVTDTPAPTSTATDTPAPTATDTATPEPSTTGEPSATAVPSQTSATTATAVPSATAGTSETPALTATPLASGTPSATHTPPPSVTPIPTSDPCLRPLLNPGFETDEGWSLVGGRPPRYSTAMAHSGQRSLFLGIAPNEPNTFSYSTTWQPVTVPAMAGSMTVSGWTFQAAEPGGGPDRQLLLVYDVDPAHNTGSGQQPIGIVFAERLNAQAWQRRALTMDVRPWRGRTLWIYSSVANDGFGGRAYMVLDDMEVSFCP